MKIIGVIPERMKSSRFHGKPLALINGKPMVQHVYENSRGCKMLDELYVSTGDQEILDCVHGFGGKTIRTRDDLYRCTNQVAEAVMDIDCDIVVIIQGDEPMVNPGMIEQAIRPIYQDMDICITNLMGKLSKRDSDSNEVKVVADNDGFALYMSRSNIPFGVDCLYKQVCIMGFKKNTLLLFPLLPESILEKTESIDMLRFLENGIQVKMILTEYETFSVDTPDDKKFVEYLMK